VSWSSEDPDLVAKVNSGELDRFLAGLRVDGVRVVDEIADQSNPSRAPTNTSSVGSEMAHYWPPRPNPAVGPGNDESPWIESESRWARSNHWLSPQGVRKESARSPQYVHKGPIAAIACRRYNCRSEALLVE
jgi:hypothetical protein